MAPFEPFSSKDQDQPSLQAIGIIALSISQLQEEVTAKVFHENVEFFGDSGKLIEWMIHWLVVFLLAYQERRDDVPIDPSSTWIVSAVRSNKVPENPKN
jgi:hypothetical protein